MAARSDDGRRGTALLAAAICVALVVGASGVAAQSRGATPVPVPPKGGGEPQAPSLPRPAEPGQSGEGSSAPMGSSSDQLSRSGGVIHPPAAVDPGMTKPAPNP